MILEQKENKAKRSFPVLAPIDPLWSLLNFGVVPFELANYADSMVTRDAAENAACWLSAAVFFALLTISIGPKAIEKEVGYFVIICALIAGICTGLAVLNLAMPPGPWGF
jgi:hypothetical protein